MSTKTGADSELQRFMRHFRDAFGIPRDEDIQTQQQEVLAEYVRIDALVHLPLTFDFHTLKERLFPFLSPFTILEYKSQRDKLQPAHVYQYSLTELGLVVTRYLTVKRKDRSEWKSISHYASCPLGGEGCAGTVDRIKKTGRTPFLLHHHLEHD